MGANPRQDGRDRCARRKGRGLGMRDRARVDSGQAGAALRKCPTHHHPPEGGLGQRAARIDLKVLWAADLIDESIRQVKRAGLNDHECALLDATQPMRLREKRGAHATLADGEAVKRVGCSSMFGIRGNGS